MTKVQRLRDQLFMLQGSRCFYCDRYIEPKDRTLEHLVADSHGGAADDANGVVICQTANELLGCATPKQKMIMLKAGNGKIECPKLSRQLLDKHFQELAAQRKAAAALDPDVPKGVVEPGVLASPNKNPRRRKKPAPALKRLGR